MRRTLLDETPAEPAGADRATPEPAREATQDLGPAWNGALDSDALAQTDGDADLGEAAMRARLAQKMFGAEAAEEPPSIGRFCVARLLGRGGMWSVYEGHDPELERRVALKLLHPNLSLEHQIRLRREAQALARVTHENVVRVYEVGEHEERMFVAMELIEGQPLREWQSGGGRDWRVLISAYTQAGRGLAAAHERDLIHRDFKPANAIMGDDGVVRVLDFGLARIVNAPETVESPRTPAPVTPTLLETRITVTGTTLGTPVYMSPEQMLGQPLTAASDQYSFCVSLYEALYGELPYQAKTSAELADKMLQGELEPPTSTAVPRRVYTALARGLSSRPASRHASMEALCEALEAAIRPPRRWLGVAALALVVGGGATAVAAGTPDHVASAPGLCDDDGPRIAERTSSLPEAARAWLEAWNEEHEQSCALDDTQRRACLFDLLDDGEAVGVAHLSDCSTPNARATRDARLTVAPVREALYVDDLEGATRALDALEAKFGDTVPPRLRGEFALLRGQIAFVWEQADVAQEAFERASTLAIKHDFPALLVDGWLGQADVQARLLQHPELAIKHLDDATTMLERVATPLDRRGWLEMLRAHLATDPAVTGPGVETDARVHLERAEAIDPVDPRLHERIASYRVEEASYRNEYDYAIETAKAIIERARRRTRPDSPSVLRARSHLANMYVGANEFDAAESLLRELLPKYDGTPLQNSRIHIGTLLDLGNTLTRLKRPEEALEVLEKTLRAVEAERYGGMQHIRTLVANASVMRALDAHADALNALDTALALSARYGQTPPGGGLPVVHVELALRVRTPEHAASIAARYGDRLLEDPVTVKLLELRKTGDAPAYEALCKALGANLEEVRARVTAAKEKAQKP